jgi:hypothetical protein
MNILQWLTTISQSTNPPGQPFVSQWSYVAMALVIPVIIGVILAALLKVIEKVFSIRLGGGSI